MAQISTKIKLYANREINFEKDVLLEDEGNGIFIKEWNLSIAKPTIEQLNAYETQATIYENNQQVIANRKKAYGTIEQQIEFITENGVEAWQEKVNQIKLENPKE